MRTQNNGSNNNGNSSSSNYFKEMNTSILLEKGQKLLERMNISGRESPLHSDDENTNNKHHDGDDDGDLFQEDDNYDDDDDDGDFNAMFNDTNGSNSHGSSVNNSNGNALQQYRNAQSNNGNRKVVGVRQLGKQFKPERAFAFPEAARKPGIVPKMWDPSEDELLRQAVKKFGERDWKKIADMVPGRNHLQCLQRWNKSLKPGLAKGHWTEEEDQKLLELLQVTQNWQEISAQIPGRNAKQCRERWYLNLDPSLKHGPWTTEEDELLLKLEEEHGGRWSVIAKYIPGRTENMVKSRFHTLQRQMVKERGWYRWEDRQIVEFCLENGRQWPFLVKLLPGRSKGQIKKRYLNLMESFPDLGKMVEIAEININSGKVNIGAKEQALKMLPYGPPDQEKQDNGSSGNKAAQSDTIKEKTKSFRVLKPATASAVQASMKKSMGSTINNSDGIFFNDNPQGLLSVFQQQQQQQQDSQIYQPATTPSFSAYSSSTSTIPFNSSIPTFQYTSPSSAVGDGKTERKKIIHHKGSSWLDDFDVQDIPPAKMHRTNSLDQIQQFIPPTIPTFAQVTLPSLSPKNVGGGYSTSLVNNSLPLSHSMGSTFSSFGDKVNFDDAANIFIGTASDGTALNSDIGSWHDNSQFQNSTFSTSHVPDLMKDGKSSDSFLDGGIMRNDFSDKNIIIPPPASSDSLTKILRGFGASSSMHTFDDPFASTGFGHVDAQSNESNNSLRSNRSKDLDKLIA